MDGGQFVLTTPRANSGSDSALAHPGTSTPLRPVMQEFHKTTVAWDVNLNDDTEYAKGDVPHRVFTAPVADAAPLHVFSADTTPLQIWEGTVLTVDAASDVMHVQLDAKIGQMARHTGEIELEWVSEQDRDLVRPGAVFYLTLFKRTRRGSIENSQELRFRRRPSWSAAQLKQVDNDAAMIASKMKEPPQSI